MEHLPEINDPAYPLPSIPYLGHLIEYDENGFFDFPQRHGWSLYHPLKIGLNEIRRHNEGPRHVNPEIQTPENIAALVQAWLFFGVLHEIFNTILGLPIPLEEFVEIRDGKRVLTTKRLRLHMSHWDDLQVHAIADHYSGQKQLTSSHLIELQSRVKDVLSVVERFFARYLDQGSRRPWARCLTLDLQLSILILAETLKATGLYVWAKHQPRQAKFGTFQALIKGSEGDLVSLDSGFTHKPGEKHPLTSIIFARPVELLRERFLDLGWCPHEHKMLCGLLVRENTGLFTASRLKRPFSCRELSHSACIPDRCSANLVKSGTYSTRHTVRCRDNSNCKFLGFDSSYLAEQIEEGRVPLIRLGCITCKYEDGRPQWSKPGPEQSDSSPQFHERLEIQNEGSGHYIALSHVWSHGLGNPVGNALPACQLRRLKAVAIQMQKEGHLAEEPAIWIDTLCVPVDPRYQSSRRKAIAGIVDVFRNARQVVVLDADLQEASGYADRSELCTRLLCSSWMRRLWTLAEAIISNESPNCRRLFVMFGDGPFEYNTVMSKGMFSNHSLDGALHSLITRLPQRIDRMDLFLGLAKALEYRSASWLEDEAICLAGISGLDIKQIVQHTTADERMKKWYSMLTEIPLAFVFHNAIRLEIEGYRWAPRSLLTTIESRVIYMPGLVDADGTASKRLASITERGVILQSVAALLIQDMKPSSTIFWSSVGFFAASNTSDDHVWILTAHLDDPDTENNGIEIEVPEGRPLVVIRNPFIDNDAILVSLSREEDDVMYCKYLRKAHLILRYGKNQNVQYFEQWDQECGHDTRITLHHMPEDRKWCIG